MPARPGADGLLFADAEPRQPGTPVQDLLMPAVLLRSELVVDHAELVHVYRARHPTVAFSTRDLRSPGIGEATRRATDAGFACVVRSPGGRMVAYDAGAVVIDHLTRRSGGARARTDPFADNAAHHLQVLRRLCDADLRIGEVEGEYCPGEFSINVAGRAKVLGSAQRVTARAALFSTVVQVDLSERVRSVLVDVSAALGYPLRAASIAGLTDFSPALGPTEVADAFGSDYRARFDLVDGPVPDALRAHVATADPGPSGDSFRVDDWARAHPAPMSSA